MPWLWELWAHPRHQRAPEGGWQTWVILGGRGAGKTRAGAEWVRAQAEGAMPRSPGRARRIALVGETIDQVRAVMVEGESGLMAVSPPDRRPVLKAMLNKLVWPNGAEAALVSAANPEALRGPQFDCAWSDETGCPAVDLGANQPNLFADGKSAESALPFGSLGVRDDEMQRRFLQAKIGYWSRPENVPVSGSTGQPMISADRIYVWTWDVRPWPDFPVRKSLWSDGPAHRLGHWITGRVSASGLAEVVAEICARAGVVDIDTGDLHGAVDGMLLERSGTAREALQTLMLAHGFDAYESGGRIVFRMRRGEPDITLAESGLVAPAASGGGAVELLRAPTSAAQDAVRLSYVESESDFRVGASEARLPGAALARVAETSLPLAMPGSRAQQLVDRWLAEGSRSRDRASFALPASRMAAEPGDVAAFDWAGRTELYRIERIVDSLGRQVEAVRVEPGLDIPTTAPERDTEIDLPSPPGPVTAIFLDLPLATGGDADHLPRLAVSTNPWTGRVAVYRSEDDESYGLVATAAKPAIIGETLDPLAPGAPGRWQRASVRVAVPTGALESADRLRVLNGGNLAAIEIAPGAWELVQFRDAVLTGAGEYTLSTLLRGLRGTDAISSGVIPAGARFVLVDDAVITLPMRLDERGLARHYRVGPARYAPSHASYHHSLVALDGVGLRPFAPAHLRARRDAVTGDLAIGWIRTCRYGADSWQGIDVPLGEEREAYRLRIVAEGTVLREVELAAPGYLYTAAQQAADGVAAGFELRVAQLSTAYGYGPERVLITDE